MGTIYNISSLHGLTGIGVIAKEIGGLGDDAEKLRMISEQTVRTVGKQLTDAKITVLSNFDESQITEEHAAFIVEANFVHKDGASLIALTMHTQLIQHVLIGRLAQPSQAATWSQSVTGLVTIQEFWMTVNRGIAQQVDLFIQAYQKANQ